MINKNDIHTPYDTQKVAFYTGASIVHKMQNSNQLKWFDELAIKHPYWTVVVKYGDKCITGTDYTLRPQFNQMLEDAKKGQFDMIIIRDLLSLMCSGIDVLSFTRDMKEYGITIFFYNDCIWTGNTDGMCRLHMTSTIAEGYCRWIDEHIMEDLDFAYENRVFPDCARNLKYSYKKGFYIDDTLKTKID